jgi:hypothetical protein
MTEPKADRESDPTAWVARVLNPALTCDETR